MSKTFLQIISWAGLLFSYCLSGYAITLSGTFPFPMQDYVAEGMGYLRQFAFGGLPFTFYSCQHTKIWANVPGQSGVVSQFHYTLSLKTDHHNGLFLVSHNP